MKLRHMIVTIVQDATPADDLGLASSVPCRIIGARCVIDDPRYETWDIDYTESVDAGGTPATLIKSDRRRTLLWNGELWQVASHEAKRVLDVLNEVPKVPDWEHCPG